MADDDCSNCEKEDCIFRPEGHYSCRVNILKEYTKIEEADIKILQTMYDNYELLDKKEIFDIDVFDGIKRILEEYNEAKKLNVEAL